MASMPSKSYSGMRSESKERPVPLVSVQMITFNHERFVAQAIESVLMQKTDFIVELVIGEDCSADSTRTICEKYERTYPDRIRLLAFECNLGMHANSRRTQEACRGKYIALLEGDDYWTDPLKLQIQVDLLERDDSLVMVYHNVEYRYEGKSGNEICAFPVAGKNGLLPPAPARTNFQDIVKGRVIPTLSVVYRAGVIRGYPVWTFTLAMADWPFFALLLQHGSALYLNRVMAVYRQHGGGVWSSIDVGQRLAGMMKAARTICGNISMTRDDRRELKHGVSMRVVRSVENLIRESRPRKALYVLLVYAEMFPGQALTETYFYKLAARALLQFVVPRF
jgi:glycosyltransferase involved in cell wall biosynthesis